MNSFANICKRSAQFETNIIKRLYSLHAAAASSSQSLYKLQEFMRLEEEQKHLIVPVFKKALLYTDQIAIKTATGEQYTYQQLYSSSKRLSHQISNFCAGRGASAVVAFLYQPNPLSTLMLWSCWMSGQVAMPLAVNDKISSAYMIDFIRQSKAKLIMTNEASAKQAAEIAQAQSIPLLSIASSYLLASGEHQKFNLNKELFISKNLVFLDSLLDNEFYSTPNRKALLLQLNPDKKPKLISHRQFNSLPSIKTALSKLAAVQELRMMWVSSEQNPNIYNELLVSSAVLSLGGKLFLGGSTTTCALTNSKYNLWSSILCVDDHNKDQINIFMADLKTYEKLIDDYEKLFAHNEFVVKYIKEYCFKNIQIMIYNGCDAADSIPKRIAEKWLEITGHFISEIK